MKGILAVSHFACLATDRATAATTDSILTHIDVGTATNGTVMLFYNPASGSDINNVEVWTSRESDFMTSGTAGAAVPSDSCGKVKIESDTSYAYARAESDTAISDLTFSSNSIATIDQIGMYVLTCPNVSRYVNVQFDGDGTGSKITAAFIGHDLEESPFAGGRTPY